MQALRNLQRFCGQGLLILQERDTTRGAREHPTAPHHAMAQDLADAQARSADIHMGFHLHEALTAVGPADRRSTRRRRADPDGSSG